MNFFKLYIGDYQRDTAHLSVTEHGAYLLMLQHYYATERPLPVGKALHRMLRAQDKAERDAIDAVAQGFWRETPDGLVNDRADEEITKAAAQAETNREIALQREAKRKAAREAARLANEHSTNRATSGQPSHSQTPEQIPSDADASAGKPAAPPAPKDVVFALGVPLLTAAGVKEANARSFLGMQSKAHGDAVVAEALQACAAERPVEPISWLQARLGPIRTGAKAGKHAGFEHLDYHDGVTAHGHLA